MISVVLFQKYFKNPINICIYIQKREMSYSGSAVMTSNLVFQYNNFLKKKSLA